MNIQSRENTLPSFAALAGGLDLVTSPLAMKAGRALAGYNYEPVDDGYKRIDGLERFDGQPRPSAASYVFLRFDAGNTALTAGQVVTGLTSGATGKLLIAGVLESGTYGGSDAAGYLVLGAVTGSYDDNEALQVGGVTKATAADDSIEFGAPTDANNVTWARLAIETARALIQPVPGSGRILGVWMFKGVVYAWRNNAGATAAVMYKSTSSGWSAVALGLTLPFTSGGVTEITAGQTITGATSGATAVLTRVVKTSGTWAGGDAAGYFVMATKTGNFVAENINVGASPNLATIAANATATTFSPNGRYELTNHNFYGGSTTEAMYGVNGVDKAFEFDGTIFSPISTGRGDDKPIHIAVSGERLYLALRGGVFDCCVTGTPQVFDGTLGAAEFGVGHEITGLVGDVLDALFVFANSLVKVLYGRSSTDFVLKTLSGSAGGIEWTMQDIINLTYLDQGGIRNTNATQNYGNFSIGTQSRYIRKLLDRKKKNGVTPIASLRCRRKTQYRLFYDDGTGLIMYLGKTRNEGGEAVSVPEILPFDLSFEISCCCSVEDTDETERMFVGSETGGYVYELDAGTSIDGQPLESALRLAFDACKAPSRNKRFHMMFLDVDKPASAADGGTDLSLRLSAEFSYAAPDQPPVREQSFAVTGGGGFWNENDYNDFYWSQEVFGRAVAHIDGQGTNISPSLYCSATYEQPHTIHSYELRYSYRGLKKGS